MQKLSMEELNRLTPEEFKRSEKTSVIAVLENIRSAYNVGSVFRTSDAFLLESVYLIGYTAQPPHKEIKKTALGAEETVNWTYFPDSISAIKYLKSINYSVFAIEQVKESLSLEKIKFVPTDKIAVIFGNEVTGVDQGTILHCDGCIEIPQLGMKHSLNIATAAGVVLWEIIKNRMSASGK